MTGTEIIIIITEGPLTTLVCYAERRDAKAEVLKKPDIFFSFFNISLLEDLLQSDGQPS